jgi:undecaprenyl diphosphate synthase
MELTAAFHPSAGSLPWHVGIIPDGGRRWAKAHQCTHKEAYIQAKSHLLQFVNYLYQKEVNEISIYVSSIQNFRRSAEDMAINFEITESALENEIASLAHERNLVIKLIGDHSVFPPSLSNVVRSLEKSTFNNSQGRLNLLIAYNPLEEIIQAIKSSDVPGNFFKYLSVTTPVDIVFRSGGAHLLSNFLPLQSAYARLCFFDKLFNDLTIKDLEEALDGFSRIVRKFGE